MKTIADTVIKNGKIYTVDKSNPWVEAVAIGDGKIIFAGKNEDVKTYEKNAKAVVDANNRLILPGFFDSHCHPSVYTYRAYGVEVYNCTTLTEYQKVILEYGVLHPDPSIIKGSGWFFSDFTEFGPDKSQLDEVISDRPVFIYSGDFHNAWVNSKTLELAGITKDTPSPDGGEIMKDENGYPTGLFTEAPAVAFLENAVSGFTAGDFKNGICRFFQDANKVGITSVRESGVIHNTGYDGYKLISEDEYTVRLAMDIFIPSEGLDSAEKKLKIAINRMKEHKKRKVMTNSVKLFMDGVCEANTAVVEVPYFGDGNNCGTPQWELNDFYRICQLADENGFQIHVHAIGDRAVRYTLNALEYAQLKNNTTNSRHLIAHTQLVCNDDLDRFKKLDVIAVPTPLWFEKESMYYQVELMNLGGERADNEYPFKSFLDRGVKIACGSDTPAATAVEVLDVPFAPVLGIQQGITRCAPGKDHTNYQNVLNPKERVSLEEMIRCYTIDAAYACFNEHVTGSIEVGKFADLIMLDQNLFEIPTEDIYLTKVLMTMLEGKIVYGDKAFKQALLKED